MASRKKKVTRVTEITEPAGDPLEGDEVPLVPPPGAQEEPTAAELAEADEAELLARFREQFGPAQCKIRVLKATPSGNAYCFSTSDDFDADRTRDIYGGGRYFLQFYVNGRPRETREIVIAEQLKPAGANGAAVPDFSAAGDKSVRDMNGFLMALLLKKADAEPSERSTVGELVEALKGLQTIAAPQKTDDGFDRFYKMFQMVREMSGDGGGGDWKSIAARELIGTAKEVASPLLQHLAAERMRAGTAGPAPRPNPGVVEQPAQVEQGGEMPITPQLIIRQGLEALKSKAMSGISVDLVIDWIMAHSNDPLYQPFLSTALAQDFEAFAAAFDPSIAQPPFETWFRSLHEGLKEAFNESLGVAGDSAGAGGH